MNNIFKSIIAAVAGIATAVVPTLIADALGHKYGLYSAPGQPAGNAPFIVATICRTVFGLAGSYVTARLAPNRPMGGAAQNFF